jgi:ABC-2 type transport system ATP-binding protein
MNAHGGKRPGTAEDARGEVVAVRHLGKSYGMVAAVADVSFTVRAGEVFGIVGPNGAGKTTTVECLAGLRVPDRGSARVLGFDPGRDRRELQQLIGVHLQSAALPSDITVQEALRLFRGLYRAGADWRELMRRWGLEEKRRARFGTLSGGQRQRLFVALALVNDPRIVILDELTTGLDPLARRTSWEAIDELRAGGTTVILVTHSMEEAEAICDRVAIVDRGRVVALDTPRRLIEGLDALGVARRRLRSGRLCLEDVFVALTDRAAACTARAPHWTHAADRVEADR